MDSPDRTWRVTSQQVTAERTPDGNIARGWNINWTTGANVSGVTFVPFPDANDVGTVAKAVHEDVMLAYDRGDLSHASVT